MLDRKGFGIWNIIFSKVFRITYKKSSEREHWKKVKEILREDKVAAYIHVPFCTGTCLFCPYARTLLPRNRKDEILEKYVEALIKEMKMYSKLIDGEDVKIIDLHAGGGTPSLVSGKHWKRLLEEFSSLFNADPKIAIEGNPEDLKDDWKVSELLDAGVAEVSLGVQSFSKRKIRVLGRRHTVEDSVRAIENLKSAGCGNINIDLMYMVPGESLEEWRRDLKKALEQGVDEITCYPTLITNYSLGYKLLLERKIPPQADWNLFKKMVYECEDTLTLSGYNGMEIYGYTKKDWKYFTVNYEMEGPLLAFGAGGTGFTGGYEYNNTTYPTEYISRINNGMLPVAVSREVEDHERAIRVAVTRLFIERKLNKEDFKQKTGKNFNNFASSSFLGPLIWFMKKMGKIRENKDSIEITRKGLITAHRITWSFVLNVPCRNVEELLKQPWPSSYTIP